MPTPLFILSAPFQDRPACINRGFCVQGCMVNAKFSTLITYIPWAQKAGAQIRANCMVSQINVGKDGRVTGVTYIENGREHEQQARLIIVAAFAIETPRLLLLSACARFPDGLANGSGLVGKGLMTHQSQDVWARFSQEVRPYKGTPVLATSQDFYATDAANDWVRGFTIHAHGFRPIAFAKAVATQHMIWGEPLQELLRDYNYYAMLTTVGEVLPYETNRVTLSDVKDRFGLPAPLVTFSYGENEQKMGKGSAAKLREIMAAAGGEVLYNGKDTAHLMGGCVMGNDPKTSVVDSYGQCHEIPNLFIAGAPVFPTGSASNPTLTIMALAARTAERITRLAGEARI